MIGIIGAMEVEIKHILLQMKQEPDADVETKNLGGIDFYKGKLAGQPVLLAQCGVGKVNAAHCASVMVTNLNLSCLINVGVAGSISHDLDIGDVVISTDIVQHDVEIPGNDPVFFAAHAPLIDVAKTAAQATLDKIGQNRTLHIGRIATGDQFIHDYDVKSNIWKNFAPLCVEMEGAAIAQVCALTNTPFLAIRAISDKADGTAHEDFPAFVEEAADISANIVMKMLTKIYS